LFFSFNFNLTAILKTTITFILFSILASSIYIFNDIMDIKEDKKHPIKRLRPLPSGKIKKLTAIILMIFLASFSLLLSLLINTTLFIVFVSYFILNILYSIKLKHISIIDISCISISFILRLVAGAVAINVSLSMWIILITFLLALFLALAKRRDDVLLSKQGKKTRKNIDGYNLEFINASMILMAGIVIMSYILYTVSEEVINRLHTHYLYITSFFVILGFMRYMQITFVEENSGSPTKIILKDKFIQIIICCWIISFFIIVKVIK
jgi:decaprenyl-phosphate phosphoribosyltransferase